MTNYRVMSISHTLRALSLVAVLFFSQYSLANQPACGDKLSGEKQASFKINAKGKIEVSAAIGEMIIDTAASQRDSTTGNRSEFKRTVTVEDFNAALTTLGQTFGLKLRDAIKPGYKNVTDTKYFTVLTFEYKGKKVDVKIRLRKYGTIEEGLPNTPENLAINANMKDVTFLEFKIDHPDFENSVLKPRGLMRDADIALIGTEKFLQNFEQIMKKSVALNPNSAKDPHAAATMAKMQNVLKRLHEENIPLKYESRTIYERSSYSIFVTNGQTQKEYEIQITQDEGIVLYSYSYNKSIDAYKSAKPLTVVELKVQVEMVDPETHDFKQEMLDNVPKLPAVRQFLIDLTNAQAPGYTANKGKQSLIKELLEAPTAASPAGQ